jgi:VWFA-related protein
MLCSRRVTLITLALTLSLLAVEQVPCQQVPQQGTAPSSSEEPTTTIRVTSKLVVVDVSVTDSNGHPVTGLKASDFTLTENGRPQPIRSFDEHSSATNGSAPTNPKLPKLGPDVFTNYTPVPANGALTVVLLDMLNTPFRQQSLVREQLSKFLNSVLPDQRIAIFGLTDRLLLLQGFTSDPEILKKALKSKVKGQLSRLLDDAANGTQSSAGEEANVDQYSNDPTTATALQNLQSLEDMTASVQQQVRVQETLDAVDLLARYLSSMSGRKNVLWFSSEFPTAIAFDDTGTGPAATLTPDIADQIRRTTDLLATTQTAIYPIDAEGLAAAPNFSSNVSSSRNNSGPAQAMALGNDFQKTATGHAAMNALAQDTGGHAFFNTNGLAEAAAQAMEAGSNFYTLTYSPADKSMNGSFRRIGVNVDNKRLHLAYRSGYYADNPADSTAVAMGTAPNKSASTDAPKAGTLTAALVRGAPNPTEILFKVRALPEKNQESTPVPGNDVDPAVKGPYRRYVIDFSADIHNVEAQSLPDGLHHLSLEFVTLVYDQNNAMVNSVSNTIAGDFPASSFQNVLKTGMKFRQQISIPVKGIYTLRVAVHDILGNHIGSVEIPVSQLVEIPEDSPTATTPVRQ